MGKSSTTPFWKVTPLAAGLAGVAFGLLSTSIARGQTQADTIATSGTTPGLPVPDSTEPPRRALSPAAHSESDASSRNDSERDAPSTTVVVSDGETAPAGVAGADGNTAEPLPSPPQIADAKANTPSESAVPMLASPAVLGSATALASTFVPSSNTIQGAGAAPRDAVSPQRPRASSLQTVGALVDLGVPDGAMAGVVVRPWSWLNVHGAVGTNTISLGVRGGVSLRLPSWFSPSLNVEAGRYFEGDARGVVNRFAPERFQNSPMAELVGYRFANLHAGVEIGNRRTAFYIHGGMSYVGSVLHNADGTLIDGDISGNQPTSVAINSDPRLRAWIPSLKLGLLLYLV